MDWVCGTHEGGEKCVYFGGELFSKETISKI